MVYASGQIIEAQQYNDLLDLGTTLTINDIFGTGSGDHGYGGLSVAGDGTETGVSNLTDVNSNDIIQSFTGGSPGSPDEWKNLRNAISACAAHQGTILPDTLPSNTELDDGDIVFAFTALNSLANVDLLAANKLDNSGPISTTNIANDVRVASWTTLVRHEFTIDFGSFDAARHFFNLSGELRISASRTGGSATPQNADWTVLLSTNSPYSFTQSDYVAITGVFTTVFGPHTGGGAYGSNLWQIEAKRDDAFPGSIFRFQSIFADIHSTVPDSVDGTLTSSIDVRSSNIFPLPGDAAIAGYTLVESVTAGS